MPSIGAAIDVGTFSGAFSFSIDAGVVVDFTCAPSCRDDAKGRGDGTSTFFPLVSAADVLRGFGVRRLSR
jgi:hypothetical protein